MLHHRFIGCDIGKTHLDLFDPHVGRPVRILNAPDAIGRFAASLAGQEALVVMEASGHHDRLLRHGLAEAGVAFARINPVRARRFAEARGRLAKTDRLDARILAEFGALLRPAPDAPPCHKRERLAAFARRRDQLVALRALQLRHLSEAFEPGILADIQGLLAHLDERIAAVEADIHRQVQASAAIAAAAARLTTAPGVGPVTAMTLLAHMPELGTLSPKAVASLAGLAPFNNDSGSRQGRRHIKGGRPRVRQALYMAALGAIRASTRLRAFFTALTDRSGSKKLALIAVARKLLTILNAMQRDQKTFA